MRPTIRNLRDNDGTEAPTSLLFFDTESYMQSTGPDATRRDGRLRLWVAAYVRRDGPHWRNPIYHRGETAEEFWSLVERLSDPRRPLWMFAHNAGWDLTQLDWWTQLDSRRWSIGPIPREPHPETGKERPPWYGRMCVSDRPTFFVARGRKGTVKIVDTFNYWPSGLAKIGAAFGLDKLPEPDFNGEAGPLWTYCQRDVDVVRVAVCELIKFWLREDCGTFQMTGPMLSLTNYKHTGKVYGGTGQRVRIVLNDKCKGRAVERGAFHGGRIEPFYIGEMCRPIHKYDCNSLYGWAMTGRLYPRKWEGRVRNPTPRKLRGKMYAFGAVADVLINTGAAGDTYTVTHQGIQFHACGRFWTTLAGPELLRALDSGHVERVREAHIYSLADLFTEWAERWLGRKVQAQRAGDKAREEFCKLMYVSLPGKFGQRGDYWQDDKTRVAWPRWGRMFAIRDRDRRKTEWRAVAGFLQKRVPGGEPGECFPAISAYVTAYAREYMRTIFGKLPAQSLLYTGTDSIICTLPGAEALERAGLVHPDEPGKFRLEGVFGSARILGPNYYELDEVTVSSGLWGKARKDERLGWVCDVWDRLPTLVNANPNGKCGFTTYQLSKIRPSAKNEAGQFGFRVPKRLSLDFEFSDRPPRLRPAFVRSERSL